jgi:hypothetical protein
MDLWRVLFYPCDRYIALRGCFQRIHFHCPAPVSTACCSSILGRFHSPTRRKLFQQDFAEPVVHTERYHLDTVVTWRFQHAADSHSIGENLQDSWALQSIRERRQSTEPGQKQTARIWWTRQMTYHFAYLRYNRSIRYQRDSGKRNETSVTIVGLHIDNFPNLSTTIWRSVLLLLSKMMTIVTMITTIPLDTYTS